MLEEPNYPDDVRRARGLLRTETERVRLIWEKIAPGYDTDIAFFERMLVAGGRDWVCSQADVNVLEIGIGTGRNLPFYPPRIQLTGVDFSPAMLEIAGRRASEMGIDADLRLGDAQALEFEDASYDHSRHHSRTVLDPGRA